MNKPKTILLLIATHKRPEITRVCFEGVRRIIEKSKHHIKPFIIVSDADNEHIVWDYGFKYTYTNNDPENLGRKFNHGVYTALFQQWDYLMQLGSDDLLHDKAIALIDEAVDMDRVMAGFNSIYFYSAQYKRVKAVRTPWIFGAGRLIRRDNIEWCIDEHGSVWPDDIAQGLDNASQDRLMDYPKNQVFILDWNERWPLVVDIKNGTNIHGYNELEYGSHSNGLQVDKVRDREWGLFREGCPELKLL